MPRITRDSLMSLEAYAKARDEFRERVLAHKKPRTVHLGEHVTLLFEDELTVRYQIQEMLRIEKMFEEAGIQDELDAYNPLVPDGTNFKATMLIEYEDRRRAQGGAGAAHRHRGPRLGRRSRAAPRVYAIADEDLPRENDAKTSAVHFLRFELTPDMVAALKRGAGLAIGVDHPAYTASIPAVAPATRAALARRPRLSAGGSRSRALRGRRHAPRSVAEIAELHREVGDRLLDQRDRVLQIVALGAGHAHRVALDRRLHLHLAVLDQLDDLLGELLLDAHADRHHLLHLVAGDLLDVAVLERRGCRRRAW